MSDPGKDLVREKDRRGISKDTGENIYSNKSGATRAQSPVLREFFSKVKAFIEFKNEQEGDKLFTLFNNPVLKKEVLYVIEQTEYEETIDSDLSIIQLSNALSSAAVVACSKNLKSLVAIEEFNLNHFKKCLSYYNQIIFIVNRGSFIGFEEIMARSIFSALKALIKILFCATSFKYENQALLFKLLALLICITLNFESDFKKIDNYLFENKKAILELASIKIEECGRKSPGVITIFKNFKTLRTKSTLIELTNSAISFPAEKFVVEVISQLHLVVAYLDKISDDDVLEAVNNLLLFKNKGIFQKELVGLTLMKQPILLSKIESINSGDFSRTQALQLAEFITRISLENQINQNKVLNNYNIYQEKLFLNYESIPDFAFETFYETIDHNVNLNLLEETTLLYLLEISADAVLLGLKTGADFLMLHQKAESSTLSFIAVISYLDYILILHVLKADVFKRKEMTNLPKSFGEVFNFSAIPPLPKSNFVLEKSSLEQVDDPSIFQSVNVSSLFSVITKVSKILNLILQHLSLFEDPIFNNTSYNENDARDWSSLDFKFLNKHIDMIVTCVISNSILIRNCQNVVDCHIDEVDTSRLDLEQYIDQINELSLAILEEMIHNHQDFGAYCLLKNFNNICLTDLRLVQICSSLLVSLMRDCGINDCILNHRSCRDVLVQFLDLFLDPSLTSFNELLEAFPEKEMLKGIYSPESPQYLSLFKSRVSSNTEELSANSSISCDSPSKNVYADMNINRIPNFSVFEENSQQQISTIPSSNANPNFRSPLQNHPDPYILTKMMDLNEFSNFPPYNSSTSNKYIPSSFEDDKLSRTDSISASYSTIPTAGSAGNYEKSPQIYNFQTNGVSSFESQKFNSSNNVGNGPQNQFSPHKGDNSMQPSIVNHYYNSDTNADGTLTHFNNSQHVGLYGEGGNNPGSVPYAVTSNQIQRQAPNTSRSQSIHVDEFDKLG